MGFHELCSILSKASSPSADKEKHVYIAWTALKPYSRILSLLGGQPAGCQAGGLDNAKQNCISQDIICVLMHFSAAVRDL